MVESLLQLSKPRFGKSNLRAQIVWVSLICTKIPDEEDEWVFGGPHYGIMDV